MIARHRRPAATGGICGAVLALWLPAHALADCKVEKYAELPVMMNGRQPIVEGTINGAAATFIADSGAFFSMLWSDRVDRFGLHFRNEAELFRLGGAGGEVSAHRTTVDDFALRGFGSNVFHKVQFLVVGSAIDAEDGVIGQNIIGRADTEFDLAKGVIRLFHSSGCEKYSLAYWHGAAPVSAMDTRPRSDITPHILGTARLNGQEITVLFDTGASSSALGEKAARRAGFDPAKAERRFASQLSPMGGSGSEVWVARFSELDLGGEKIRNVRLPVSDSPAFEQFDMLLGVDFFLSHRIYVAPGQNRLYFTYNGGPVFDIKEPDDSAAPAAATPAAATANPSANGGTGGAEALTGAGALTGAEALTDAGALTRRSAAEMTRGDYAHAITDLDAAIRIKPNDAENLARRGAAKWKMHDLVGARADYDAALKLKPDTAPWLGSRGALLLAMKDEAGAAADFDEYIRRTPAQQDPELDVARIYADDGRYELAIGHLSRWIDKNPRSGEVQSVLNTRCWYRAKWDQQLEQALADCNAALKGRPSYGEALDSRGLVWLRLGRYDKSISDYKSALRVSPKSAWSLYGLGLAQLRHGDSVAGNRSMQEALAVDSRAAENFKSIGLAP